MNVVLHFNSHFSVIALSLNKMADGHFTLEKMSHLLVYVDEKTEAMDELNKCYLFLQLRDMDNNTYILPPTVPTKLLGTPPFFQCILIALRVLEKVQILPERLGSR